MNKNKARERLIAAYEEISKLTRSLCDTKCKLAALDSQGCFRCCSPEYCNLAKQMARSMWDTELEPTDHPTLPFMGPKGCTIAPHLRPLCTLHLCCEFEVMVPSEVSSQYWKLREEIDTLETTLDRKTFIGDCGPN